MKIKNYLLIMFATVSVSGMAQTLFVPNSTGGISYSENANVGIGTNTPISNLHVTDIGRTSLRIGGPSTSGGAVGDLIFYPSDFNSVGNAKYWDWSFRTDSWSGNAGDFVLYSHNGSSYTSPIIFQSDGDVILTTADNINAPRVGNVGIGTSSPTKKLDVNGDINFTGNLYKNGAMVSPGFWSQSGTNIYYTSGNVGIGTNLPGSTYKLNVAGIIYARDGLDIPTNSTLNIGAENASTGHLKIHNASCCYNTYADIKGNLYFRSDPSGKGLGIQSDGTVLIGMSPRYDNSITDTKGNKLMVNGGILCESLTVETDVPGADYVFESDYNLRSLKEVEQFVNENKHLPEVPSAAEFKQNGYKVGEMDDLLLRKVEELTLYLIEQNKRIEALEIENKELRKNY